LNYLVNGPTGLSNLPGVFAITKIHLFFFEWTFFDAFYHPNSVSHQPQLTISLSTSQLTQATIWEGTPGIFSTRISNIQRYWWASSVDVADRITAMLEAVSGAIFYPSSEKRFKKKNKFFRILHIFNDANFPTKVFP
jgi:hypothetical protein